MRKTAQQQTGILKNQEELLAAELKPNLEIEFDGVVNDPRGKLKFSIHNSPRGGVAENFRLHGDIITPEDRKDVPPPKRTEPYIIEPAEVPLRDLDASTSMISKPTCHPGEDLRLSEYPRFYITGPGYRASPELFQTVHETMLNKEQTGGKVKIDLLYEDRAGKEYTENVIHIPMPSDKPVDLKTATSQTTNIITAPIRSPPDRRTKRKKVVERVKEKISRE